MKMTWGSWTLYTDVVVPFTNYVLCIDLGRHPSFGYRWR